MKKQRFRVVTGIVGILAASGATASPDTYRVSADLSQDGQTFATPVLIVQRGVPADIEVSGSKGYRFEITVDAADNASVRVATQLSKNNEKVSPVLLVKLGESASVRVGDIGIKLTTSTNVT